MKPVVMNRLKMVVFVQISKFNSVLKNLSIALLAKSALTTISACRAMVGGTQKMFYKLFQAI
jgi:hypothetical protein